MSDDDILARAWAALQESHDGLNSLSKAEIVEVKSMKSPPPKLQAVLTCVAMLKGMKEPDTWQTIKKMLTDTGFINSLMTISFEDLKDAKVARVQELIAREELSPETVRRFSRFAEALIVWVIALIGCYTRYTAVTGSTAASGSANSDAKAPEGSSSAAPTSTSELVWQQLNGVELESQLTVDPELGGAPIRLVDARYLIKLAQEGGRLVRRQDLPETAFVPLGTVRRLGLGTSNSLRLVAVSHAWLTPLHPDPRGDSLRLLATALELLLRHLDNEGDEPDELRTYGVMLDFCSAVQKGAAGEPRSAQEGALFTRALTQMGDWYSHQETIVLKLTKMPERYPEGFEFPAGCVANTADYSGRGWCFEEASVAGLIKSSGKVLDLEQHRSASSLDELKRECKTGRTPPLTPAEFNRRLETKSFTSRKADLEQVPTPLDMGILANLWKCVPGCS